MCKAFVNRTRREKTNLCRSRWSAHHQRQMTRRIMSILYSTLFMTQTGTQPLCRRPITQERSSSMSLVSTKRQLLRVFVKTKSGIWIFSIQNYSSCYCSSWKAAWHYPTLQYGINAYEFKGSMYFLIEVIELYLISDMSCSFEKKLLMKQMLTKNNLFEIHTCER